jgi:hypothetical protein
MVNLPHGFTVELPGGVVHIVCDQCGASRSGRYHVEIEEAEVWAWAHRCETADSD